MSKLLAMVTIILSMVVSPNLMYLVGIDYATETGSLLEKIHPSTTFCCLIFLVSFVISGRLKFKYLKPHEFSTVLAIVVAVVAILLLLARPVTSILVTFLTPILFCYALGLGGRSATTGIERLVCGMLLLNSVIGIGEALLGTAILPRIAGSVIIYNDTRSIGFVGHPLTSSFLTGLVLLYLVLSRMMSKFDGWSMAQIGVHAAGLVAFGGRVALVSTIALIAIYVLLDGSAVVRRQSAFVRRILIITGGVTLGAVVLFSGLADNTISRFTSDEGSALTRSSALQIVEGMSWDELAFGVSPSQKTAIMRAFGTEYGIEVTWIAWLVDYGVFITAALVIALTMILVICLRGAQRYHWYMTVYFLICITGSQGLGSKSLLLAWFVMIMLTFGRTLPQGAALARPLDPRAAATAGT
jgi:hypothetical protein